MNLAISDSSCTLLTYHLSQHLASRAGRTYSLPWDSLKEVGCYCDKGYRGPACDLQECPSGPDVLGKKHLVDVLCMKSCVIVKFRNSSSYYLIANMTLWRLFFPTLTSNHFIMLPDGYGSEAGRECSGRGLCAYDSGVCRCFTGFYGFRCHLQTTVF